MCWTQIIENLLQLLFVHLTLHVLPTPNRLNSGRIQAYSSYYGNYSKYLEILNSVIVISENVFKYRSPVTSEIYRKYRWVCFES